jgi:hypothetical protein
MEGQRQDRQRVAVPPLSSREAVFDRWPPPRLSGSAESEVRSGRADLALALLERLITEVRASGLRWQEAELLRVSGEARLLGSPADLDRAGSALETASAMSREQGARAFESRRLCLWGSSINRAAGPRKRMPYSRPRSKASHQQPTCLRSQKHRCYSIRWVARTTPPYPQRSGSRF